MAQREALWVLVEFRGGKTCAIKISVGGGQCLSQIEAGLLMCFRNKCYHGTSSGHPSPEFLSGLHYMSHTALTRWHMRCPWCCSSSMYLFALVLHASNNNNILSLLLCILVMATQSKSRWQAMPSRGVFKLTSSRHWMNRSDSAPNFRDPYGNDLSLLHTPKYLGVPVGSQIVMMTWQFSLSRWNIVYSPCNKFKAPPLSRLEDYMKRISGRPTLNAVAFPCMQSAFDMQSLIYELAKEQSNCSSNCQEAALSASTLHIDR